jgi:hypothetical protein
MDYDRNALLHSLLRRFMSSFVTQKLDECSKNYDNSRMGHDATLPAGRQTTGLVRHRVKRGGERLWRLEDFKDLPFTAVAQALSRLTRSGELDRLSKGLYYRPRRTAFGKSHPNPTAIQKLAMRRKPMFASGTAAANLLGFTTQSPGRSEIATSAGSLPRKLVGQNTLIRTRRPAAWAHLPQEDAALLDFLRQAGKSSELSSEATVQRMLAFLSTDGRFERLLKVAQTEPPRVRAMLGALGEELGKEPNLLQHLRNSLNPLSRFDFGMFASLRFAQKWQVKEPLRRAAV